MEHEAIRELGAAYALDALDSDERRRFEDHLAQCPECQEEVGSFQETASLLADGIEAAHPPRELRERILSEARSERETVVPLRRRVALPAVAAVAAVAAGVAIGLGIWAAQLSSDLDTEREARQQQEQLAAILTDPAASEFLLQGANGTLVVSSSGEAALLLTDLESTSTDRTYQAWVVREGNARGAGTFDSAGELTVALLQREVQTGDVVGVTVEPAGGSDQPTADPQFATEVT